MISAVILSGVLLLIAGLFFNVMWVQWLGVLLIISPVLIVLAIAILFVIFNN